MGSKRYAAFGALIADVPLPAFKALVREQFYMLLLDQEAALAALPSMLPSDAETRLEAFDLIGQVLAARGELSEEDKNRLGEVARLFGVDEGGSAGRPPFRKARKERAGKSSRNSAPAPHEGRRLEK